MSEPQHSDAESKKAQAAQKKQGTGVKKKQAKGGKKKQGKAAKAPQLAFPNVVVWVREWLAHNYKRRISRGSGHVWAADWWRYPEAVSRLEALWRAWEHLRLDPATGISVWYRDHADHHMRVLMDPNESPFGRHGSETEDVTDPLPHVDPPSSMF